MFLREFQEAYYQIINEGIENDFIKYFNEFLQKHPDELEYLTRHQKELKLKLVELKGTKKLKDIKPEDFLKELTSWMKEDKSYESKKGLENAHKNETFKGNKDIEWINEDDYKKGIGKVRIFRPLTTEGSIEIGQPGKFGKKLAKWCTSANSKTNMFNEHVYDGGMCTHNIIYIIPDAVEDINNTKIALRIAEDGLLDNFENSLNNQKFKKVDLNKLNEGISL